MFLPFTNEEYLKYKALAGASCWFPPDNIVYEITVYAIVRSKCKDLEDVYKAINGATISYLASLENSAAVAYSGDTLDSLTFSVDLLEKVVKGTYSNNNKASLMKTFIFKENIVFYDDGLKLNFPSAYRDILSIINEVLCKAQAICHKILLDSHMMIAIKGPYFESQLAEQLCGQTLELDCSLAYQVRKVNNLLVRINNVEKLIYTMIDQPLKNTLYILKPGHPCIDAIGVFDVKHGGVISEWLFFKYLWYRIHNMIARLLI